MPFGPLFTPSMALSLLQPSLRRRGFSARTHYFLIDYAERVGMRFYSGIAGSSSIPLDRMAGEWIFSGTLFDDDGDAPQAYLRDVLRMPKRMRERVLRAREDAPAFLDACVETLLRDAPRVVGFTSTFQQHAASLALAKRIKAASPETFVVMGGANCEGIMGAETVRQFPFVDACVSGEGENILPELVRRAIDGIPIDSLPGVRTRDSDRIDNTPPILDLDELPEADFEEYVAQFERSRTGRTYQPRLMFETSRGCWWGERMHCTFCGLNGGTMRYRSKSPQRALGELQSIMDRYPGLDVDITDNILDLDYFDSVLPELARRNGGIELFYETKSNLRKEQVRLLRDAGILRIQPGIESLSDAVLKLMRKGVTGLQNIQLLKWCRELGLRAPWNLLAGFPGEPESEYARMAELVPLLAHLQPPEYVGTIRLDRFSPNFTDAEKLGFTNVQPFASYRHVYRGLSEEAVRNLAYFFTYDYREAREPERYLAPLRAAAYDWREAHATSALFSVDSADHLTVWDLRPIAKQFLTVLSGLERRVLLACDAVAYGRALATTLHCSEDELRIAADALIARGFLLRDGDRLLALSIPLGEYSPAPAIVQRFQHIARKVGERAGRSVAIPFNVQAVPPADVRPRLGKPRPLTPSRFAIERDHVLLR